MHIKKLNVYIHMFLSRKHIMKKKVVLNTSSFKKPLLYSFMYTVTINLELLFLMKNTNLSLY